MQMDAIDPRTNLQHARSTPLKLELACSQPSLLPPPGDAKILRPPRLVIDFQLFFFNPNRLFFFFLLNHAFKY